MDGATSEIKLVCRPSSLDLPGHTLLVYDVRKPATSGIQRDRFAERVRAHARGAPSGRGHLSWLAIPFYVLFELLGPVIEALGLVVLLTGAAFGLIAWPEAAVFLLLALLYAAAFLENFGYRQLTVWWRLKGFFRWVTGRRHKWETITRSASVGAG
jgi:hypothetical protein